MKKRGLGRGLDALIPAKKPEDERFQEIEISLIRKNPYQPREKFDTSKMDELAKTIKETGVVQPLLVRRKGTIYELISGERRLRAAEKAGLTSVPCIVKSVSDREMLEMALVENLQREDLNPVEEAQAYKTLHEKFGLTHDEIAKRVGKDRATITNRIRLLKLPHEVLEGLKQNLISEGHAKLILSLHPAQKMVDAYRVTVEKKLSVRALEKLLSAKKVEHKEENPDLKNILREIEKTLQAKVEIIMKGKSGKIIIKFANIEHLNDILDKLGVRNSLD